MSDTELQSPCAASRRQSRAARTTEHLPIVFYRQLLPRQHPTDRSCLQPSTTLFSSARWFSLFVCKSWLLTARMANVAMLGLQTGNLADS